MTFGAILKQLRREKHLGIKSLAPALGINYSYLSKLESETTSPSFEMVSRVATYFDYDCSKLLISAGKVPEEILRILQQNPDEALAFLRERFGRPNGG